MGIFEGLKGNKDAGGKNRTEHFFGEVVSYDIAGTPKTVTVKHTETGDVRKVTLNPDAKFQLKEGMVRPDIQHFANRGKMQTAVGGVIRIEGAFRDAKEGVWKARWLSGAIHSPADGYARAFSEARVGTYQDNGSTTPYRALDVLDSQAAKRVANRAEFDAAIAGAVNTHGGAFIRVLDGDENKTRAYLLLGGKRDAPLEDRITRACSSESYEKVAAALEHIGPKDIVEVVPAKRIMFGADAAKSPKLDAMFTREGGGSRYPLGFGEVLATVHVREDQSEFVTSALPRSKETVFSRVGNFDLAASAPAAGAAVSASAPEAAPYGEEPELPDADLDALMGDEPAPTSRGPGM